MGTSMRTMSAAALLVLLPAGCGEEGASPDEGAGHSMRDSLGTPLGAVSARIVRANAASLAPLARVEVQPDELLEFYEPRPGVVLMSAAGRPRGPARMMDGGLRRLTPAQLWQRVVGARAMPAELLAAIERSKSVQWTEEPADEEGASPLQAQASSAPGTSWTDPQQLPLRGRTEHPVRAHAALKEVDGGWCDTVWLSRSENACGPSNADIQYCRNNHWNGAWVSAPRVEHYDASVCAAGGDMVYKLAASKTYRSYLRDVPEDTYRSSWAADFNCGTLPTSCPNVRLDILEAAGDRFHWRFWGWRE